MIRCEFPSLDNGHSMKKNLYEILEIKPSATQEEIKKNYHYLLHAYHPDKFPGEELKQKAETKTKEIINAYGTLGDPQKRKRYDAFINEVNKPKKNNETKIPYSKTEAPNPKTHQTNKNGFTQYSENKHQENPNIKFGICQNCQKISEVQNLRFSRVHTILFFYYRMRIKMGFICGKCSIQLFWKYTCITVLFGWLGIGLLPSIVVLIGNFINFIKSSKLRKTYSNRFDIAFGWKLTTVSFIFLAAYLFVLPKINNSDRQENPTQNTPSTSNNVLEDGNYEVTNTLTPTMDYLDMVRTYEAKHGKNYDGNNASAISPTCSKWNKISSFDVGKTMCVYGTVYDSYWGGDIFFIRFSKTPNSFRFIVLNNRYFEDIDNKCIQATGLIEKTGDLLYMELGDRLDPCN
jgi:hypothetical protein